MKENRPKMRNFLKSHLNKHAISEQSSIAEVARKSGVPSSTLYRRKAKLSADPLSYKQDFRYYYEVLNQLAIDSNGEVLSFPEIVRILKFRMKTAPSRQTLKRLLENIRIATNSIQPYVKFKDLKLADSCLVESLHVNFSEDCNTIAGGFNNFFSIIVLSTPTNRQFWMIRKNKGIHYTCHYKKFIRHIFNVIEEFRILAQVREECVTDYKLLADGKQVKKIFHKNFQLNAALKSFGKTGYLLNEC